MVGHLRITRGPAMLHAGKGGSGLQRLMLSPEWLLTLRLLFCASAHWHVPPGTSAIPMAG